MQENKTKIGAAEIVLGVINTLFACMFLALLTEFFIEIYIFNGDDWTNIGMIFIFWLSFFPVLLINPLWLLPLAGKRPCVFSLAAYAAEVHLWLFVIIAAFVF